MKLLAKVLTAITVSFSLILITLTPAQAATITPLPTATNGIVTVSTDASGILYATKNGATTKVSSDLTRNGVSSINFINNKFVATSFFKIAYSNDGYTWTANSAPAGEKFNPANIITDANFFNKNSMTVEQIQAFMESKVNCTNGACLKDYHETTFDRPANFMCDAYVGAPNESSATILWKVSQACNVSTDVMLITLQKEQGLVTASAPSASKFKIAMGYACPDTAACDSAYFGFYNQVYNSAKQFQRYTNPAGTSKHFTWYPVGVPTKILYNPDTTCGSASVTIANKATAGLYYYTPYQPNQASLNAGWGSGDTCSAYGNRNFWQYYNAWFNKDTNYKTFIQWNGSKYILVDDEGSVATSTNLVDWKRQNPIVHTSSVVKTVLDTQVKAVLADSTVQATTDGATWTSSTYAEPTPPPVVSPVAIKHTVKKGDTMVGIAKKYKTTVKQILKWNPSIKNASLIRVNQKIVVGYKAS